MSESPAIVDLYAAKQITLAELCAAVDAVFSDVITEDFPISCGYVLDLSLAISTHPIAHKLLGTQATLGFKRNVVRAAILQAKPAKAI